MNVQTFNLANLNRIRANNVHRQVTTDLEPSIRRATIKFWRWLLGELRARPRLEHLETRLRAAFPDIEGVLADGLTRVAKAGYAQAVSNWASTRGEPITVTHVQEARVEIRIGKAFVFKPLSQEDVREIVERKFHGMTWRQRLRHWSRKISDVEGVRDRIVQLYSRGANIDEMTRELMPLVSMIEASARRIARTEGMRVAHETQDAVDLAAGVEEWLYHATLDDVVRPEHAADHGKVFNRRNKITLPRGPNCRCYYTAVLPDDYPDNVDPKMRAAYESWKRSHPNVREAQESAA